MVNLGYTLLPTEDAANDNQMTYTYSSRIDESIDRRYRSIFTYSNAHRVTENEYSKSADRILANICHVFLIFWSYILLIVTFPITAWFCLKKISPYEKLVLFRIGRLQAVKGPGIVCLLPWIDNWKIINVLIRGFIIPPQQLILKDGCIVEVGGEIHFRIEDVVKSVTHVQDLDNSMRLLGQTVLTDILHQVTLDELQTDQHILILKFQDRLKDVVQKWGVSIMKFELTPPNVLQSATPGYNSSPLGHLLTSIQSILQKPNNEPLLLRSSKPPEPEKNVIHNFMTNTAFPIILSSDAICGQDVGGVYKLEINGNQGGVFWLNTKEGRTAVDVLDAFGKPDVVVSLSDEDFIALITSKMTLLQAFIGNKLRVTGDVKKLSYFKTILTKLQSTFTTTGDASPLTSKSCTNIQIV